MAYHSLFLIEVLNNLHISVIQAYSANARVSRINMVKIEHSFTHAYTVYYNRFLDRFSVTPLRF